MYVYALYFHHQTHPHLGIASTLAQPLHAFWSYSSALLQYPIGHLLTWGVHHSVSYLLVFSYYSRSSQGKNVELVCHSLLQWTTFSELSTTTHSSWMALHCMAHSFIHLDKVVIHVISYLVFCDCGFHSVCPLMDEENRLVEAS